jgi:Fe-S cluster biogenesis protein NfuA
MKPVFLQSRLFNRITPLKPCIRHSKPTINPPKSSNNGSGPAITTDTDVPEGHKELHSYLYEETAKAHESTSTYNFRDGEDDGTTLLPTASYLEARTGEKPTGVYAIYDTKRNLQFVSFSRNVVLAIKAHFSRVGEDKCAFVKVMVFANKAMQSKSALEREAANWLEEAGTLPPGNGAEKDLWVQDSPFDTKSMSAIELAAYEEKKLKLRKAMGEKLGDADTDVSGLNEDAAQRRMNLIKAVEGDNWSAVVGEQTDETIVNTPSISNNGSNGQQQQQIVTPFARASVHRAVGESSSSPSSSNGAHPTPPLVLSIETVDKVLDDVRPYLIADGGNVEVVSVTQSGIIAVSLQGACGTCPSSTSTMKMGIERALKSAFGDAVSEVIQVASSGAAAAEDDSRPTVEKVDMHLNILRGAIHGYGGSVEVRAVEASRCVLVYKGPMPIGYGVRAAVKDKFPELSEVIMIDAESENPLVFD